MKKQRKENRLWTSQECLEAICPKLNRRRLLTLAVLSGAVRRMS